MGIVLVFLFYGFLGWIIDSLYRSYMDRQWRRGGFSRLPFTPTYGLGALILLALSPAILSLPSWLQLLILGITFGFYEYLCGIFSLYVLKRRFWNYAKGFLNIQGQTDLLHSTYWAILSFIVIHWFHPWILSWIPQMHL